MVFRCFSHLTEWALGAQGGTAVRMGSASRKSISSTSIVYKHETCSSRLEPSRDREREWKRYFRWLRYTMTHIWVVCGWFVCVCATLLAFFTSVRGRAICLLKGKCFVFISFRWINTSDANTMNDRTSERKLRVLRSSFGTRRTHASMYVCVLCALVGVQVQNTFAFIYNLPRIHDLA